MTVYLDTSALVKLLGQEASTVALRSFLAAQPGVRRTASALVRTELRRALQRASPDQLPNADALLSRLALVPLDAALLDHAGALPGISLRSLDALHVASALRIRPLTAFVTYDLRMQDAARALDLPVVAPSG